jgi:Flp pilus assembly protein CpaB
VAREASLADHAAQVLDVDLEQVGSHRGREHGRVRLQVGHREARYPDARGETAKRRSTHSVVPDMFLGATTTPEPAFGHRRALRARISTGHAAMVVAGVIGGLLTLVALRSADERVDVAVAARDLASGDVVRAADIRYASVGASGPVLARLVERSDVSGVIGTIVARPVGEGEPVRRGDVRPPAAPAGRRAMSIPVAPARAVNGRIAPGDLVDVVVAWEREIAIVVAGARVLDVQAPGGGALGIDSELGVTLAVDARGAQLLAAATADGDVFLTRATGAASAAGTPPLTIDGRAGTEVAT